MTFEDAVWIGLDLKAGRDYQVTHTHPCADCGTPVECDGEREANHDGWPATICRAYHLDNGGLALVLCEFCAKKES
jgi:hypothetical protein